MLYFFPVSAIVVDSVVDLHWFQRGSGSGFFYLNTDPDPDPGGSHKNFTFYMENLFTDPWIRKS